MRPKYRVWNSNVNRFENWHVMNQEGRIVTTEARGLRINEYTHRTDCNNKEIYEGDIIKYNFKSLIEKEGINRDRIAPVYWQKFRGCWAIKESKYCNNDLFTYIQNGNVVEVIGNIYENSELLEEINNGKR